MPHATREQVIARSIRARLTAMRELQQIRARPGVLSQLGPSAGRIAQNIGVLRLGRRRTMAMENMITVENTILATVADFLAGTQLDQPGVPGVFTIWGASTVGDSTITISLGGQRIVDGATLVLRANSEIRENDDPFYQMLSRTGGRPVIAITEVTAMTARIRVKFLPA